jgi:hypothetical protein
MFTLRVRWGRIGNFHPLVWVSETYLFSDTLCSSEYQQGRCRHTPNLEQSQFKTEPFELEFCYILYCSRHEPTVPGTGDVQATSCQLRNKLTKAQNFCKQEPGSKTFCWEISAVPSTFSVSFVPFYSGPWRPFSVPFLSTRALPPADASPVLSLGQHSVGGHN